MFGLGRKSDVGRVGIGLHPDGVSGAVVACGAEGPVIERVVFSAVEEGADSTTRIHELISRLDAGDMPASAVLSPRDYNLLQVESPEVPDEELAEAVRWRIKDMIDFHIDDAVIDLFKLPQSSRPGAPALMYVIAARSSIVERCIRDIEDAGANLDAVDITELALRNLQTLQQDVGRPVATLYLTAQLGLMEITQQQQLFLSRQLTLADDLLEQDATGRHPGLEALVLELQRSLDYFESQYAQGSADHLAVMSDNTAAGQALLSVASEYLTVPVRELAPEAGLALGADVDPAELSRCMTAIGGALRGLT